MPILSHTKIQLSTVLYKKSPFKHNLHLDLDNCRDLTGLFTQHIETQVQLIGLGTEEPPVPAWYELPWPTLQQCVAARCGLSLLTALIAACQWGTMPTSSPCSPSLLASQTLASLQEWRQTLALLQQVPPVSVLQYWGSLAVLAGLLHCSPVDHRRVLLDIITVIHTMATHNKQSS